MSIDCLKEKAISERTDLAASQIQRKIAEDQVNFTRVVISSNPRNRRVFTKRDEIRDTGGLVKDSAYAGLRLSFPFFEGGLRVAEVQEVRKKDRLIMHMQI